MKKCVGKTISFILIMAMCFNLLMPAMTVAAETTDVADPAVVSEDHGMDDADPSDETADVLPDETAASDETEASPADEPSDEAKELDEDAAPTDIPDEKGDEEAVDASEKKPEADEAIIEGSSEESLSTVETDEQEEPASEEDGQADSEVDFDASEYAADADFEIANGVLKKYKGTEEKNVVIPAGVISIDPDVFKGHAEIETVSFPDGLTTIGDRAFKYCTSLQTPKLPATLTTIGSGAFYGAALGTKMKLGELVIPAGVTQIFYESFKSCSLLGSVRFEGYEGEKTQPIEFVTSSGGGMQFESCENLKKITLSDRIEEIPDDFAKGCASLEEVVWSDTVTSIGVNAFSGTSLQNADLSKTKLTSIGDRAFKYCTALEAPKFPATLKKIGSEAFHGAALGTKMKLGELVIPASVTQIFYDSFKSCSLLGSVRFEGYEGEKTQPIEFVTSSGGGMQFENCENLKKITLSDRIEEIPDGFAKECASLEEVIWSDTVTSIGVNAFSSTSLQNADLSKTKLTSIGDRAFKYCTSLDAPKFPATLKTIGSEAFHGAALGTKMELGELVIPAGVTQIFYESFKSCNLLGSVLFEGYEGEKTLPVEFVGTYGGTYMQFENCENLKKITLSDRIEKIPSGFAKECASLEEVVWSDTVTSIGDDAFKGTPLKKADLFQTKLTSIGRRAFKYCTALEAPKFPATLKTIGSEAFCGAALGTASRPGTIYIPSDVEEIENNAFQQAKYLGKVVFGPDNGWDIHMAVGSYCFDRCENLKILIVTSRVDVIPSHFASGCINLKNIKIEDGIKEIGEYAFLVNNARTKVKTTVEGSSSVVKNYDWKRDNRTRTEGRIKTDLDLGDQAEEIPDEASFYVSFVTYGGSVIAAVEVNKGSKLTKPDDPEKDGYTFAGWYKDADYTSVWNFNVDTVKERTCLYAKWEKIHEAETDTPDEEEDEYIRYDQDARIVLTDANCKIDSVKPKTYDGISYKPALTVKYLPADSSSYIKLIEGVDYQVRYENNVNAGTGTAYVIGCGKYTGDTVKTTLTIRKKAMSKLKVVAGGTTAGSNIKPNIYVYDSDKLLLPGVDYNADWTGYKGDTKGTYKIPLNATEGSNYSGTVKAAVTVYKASKILSASNTDVLLEDQATYKAEYNAAAIRPRVTVKYYGQVLEPKNYKVTYVNNKNAGTAYVKISGKKKYAGSVVKTFEIMPVKKDFVLNKSDISVTYNGKLQRPKVTVRASFTKADGKEIKVKLKAGVDYTITYRNNLHASGNAEIVIKGKGNYTGYSQKTEKFTIKPIKLSKAKISGKKDSYKLSYAGRDLIEGKDYVFVKYGDEKKGRIDVILKGKGDFGAEPDTEITKKVSLN